MKTKTTFWPALAGIMLTVSLVGCGGGGGGSSNVPGTCDTSTYTPNYANLSNLRHWSSFPLRVFLNSANQTTVNLT